MEVLLICKTPLTTTSPSWPLRGSILGWFGDQRSWRQSAWTWIPTPFLENSFSGLSSDHQKDSIQSVQFSHSVVSNSLWPHGLQHARLSCPSPTPRVYSNSCPLSWWCHQPSHPLLSPSPPAFNLSQHQGLFQCVSFSHEVAKVLALQLQHQSFQWVFGTYFL